MKLGQSKEDKLRRVTLQIDISDIGFAFKVRTKVLNPIYLAIQQVFCLLAIYYLIDDTGTSFLSKMSGAAKMLARQTYQKYHPGRPMLR